MRSVHAAFSPYLTQANAGRRCRRSLFPADAACFAAGKTSVAKTEKPFLRRAFGFFMPFLLLPSLFQTPPIQRSTPTQDPLFTAVRLVNDANSPYAQARNAGMLQFSRLGKPEGRIKALLEFEKCIPALSSETEPSPKALMHLLQQNLYRENESGYEKVNAPLFETWQGKERLWVDMGSVSLSLLGAKQHIEALLKQDNLKTPCPGSPLAARALFNYILRCEGVCDFSIFPKGSLPHQTVAQNKGMQRYLDSRVLSVACQLKVYVSSASPDELYDASPEDVQHFVEADPSSRIAIASHLVGFTYMRPDLLDALLNMKLEVVICNGVSKDFEGFAAVDNNRFYLSSNDLWQTRASNSTVCHEFTHLLDALLNGTKTSSQNLDGLLPGMTSDEEVLFRKARKRLLNRYLVEYQKQYPFAVQPEQAPPRSDGWWDRYSIPHLRNYAFLSNDEGNWVEFLSTTLALYAAQPGVLRGVDADLYDAYNHYFNRYGDVFLPPLKQQGHMSLEVFNRVKEAGRVFKQKTNEGEEIEPPQLNSYNDTPGKVGYNRGKL